jgi:ERF superfamily
MKVYKAINAVQAELARVGISKARTNTQGSGYKFRGIDDVFNAISPLLATHGLCILPRMLTRTCDERLSNKGGNLFYVTVEAEFDFVSAEDGSKHTVKTFGEAMDSGDKATNKAMSAAYKYAALQAFAIPTEGDNDTENQTHEVLPKQKLPLAPHRLEGAIKQIKSGNYTIQGLHENFAITPEQDAQILEALSNA